MWPFWHSLFGLIVVGGVFFVLDALIINKRDDKRVKCFLLYKVDLGNSHASKVTQSEKQNISKCVILGFRLLYIKQPSDVTNVEQFVWSEDVFTAIRSSVNSSTNPKTTPFYVSGVFIQIRTGSRKDLLSLYFFTFIHLGKSIIRVWGSAN